MSASGQSSGHEQLQRDYLHLLSDEHRRRWALSNPGNMAALEERARVLNYLARDRISSHPELCLDLGCGSLSLLPAEILPALVIGVDLLLSRLLDTQEPDDDTPKVNADGSILPFSDGVFDVVVMSTMLSSVLDPVARSRICTEVSRVLKVSGVVLWYDLRMPSPANTATRPVGRHELRRHFAGFSGPIRSLTVAPPLARRLGRFTPVLYRLLAYLPAVRSHLAACLVKAPQ
ncbi:class I SAM-dependent methyltransferase [soil metagenome]